MIQRVLLGKAHVARAIALALAALSLAWGVALTEGLLAAMVGAAAGSLLGQHLAQSRLRLGAALAACGLGLAGALGLAALLVGTEVVPRWLGAEGALSVTACLRFGAIAIATAAALRVVAARRRAALGLELAFVAISITTVFAAHRDGIIARPLWLSDWAFRQGLDPARILLAVGGLAAGALALLILLEAKSDRPIWSVLVVVALSILAATGVNAWSMPAPDPLTDLGLNGGDQASDAGAQPSEAGPPDDAGGARPSNADATDAGGGRDFPVGRGGGGPEPTRAGGQGGNDASESARGHGGGDGSRSGHGDQSGERGGSGPRNTDRDAGTSDAGTSDAGASDAGTSDAGSKGEATPSPSSLDQLSEKDDDDTPPRSPTPMAVVLLDHDYSPPSKNYYFREEALSQYNGARLVANTRSGVDLDIPSGFPAEETPVAAPPPPEGRAVVDTTVVLLTEHTKPFALEAPTLLAPAQNPDPARFRRAYRVSSLSQTISYSDLLGRVAGDPGWSPAVRAHYTEPPSDPRYGALAAAIAAGLRPDLRADPFAMAASIKLYLDKEVTYSTKAKHAGAADPTADMLFGDRIGYCVHFAHAAVFLWRSLGIPARVGIGYHSDEDNRRSGSTILLRASDAHAWPELYLQGLGWIVLDISPAQNLDEPIPPVDDELQRLLGQMARGERPDEVEERRTTPKIREIIRQIGAAAFLAALAAVVLLYLIKIARRLSPRFAGDDSISIAAYRSALDALAEAGLSRRYGETREAFAERARGLSPTFEELTWMHLDARLGGPNAERAERTQRAAPSPEAFRDALQKIRAEIAERGSPLRRLVGAINPASFLDAR